jgi:hypothetical protein
MTADLEEHAGWQAEGASGRRVRSGAEGVLKAICRTPALVVSAAIVMIVLELLPASVGAVVGWIWIGVIAALALRSAESMAVRALLGARAVAVHDGSRVGAVLADLRRHHLGVEQISVYTSRRRQSEPVHAFGRRSLVIERTYVMEMATGAVAHDEAVAVFAHGALILRSGRTRLDLAIHLWSAPRRVIRSVAPPRRGVLGLAWRLRPIIFGVAVCHSFRDPTPDAPATGHGVGIALATLLVMTYLSPWLDTRWDEYVVDQGDRDAARAGFGPVLASAVRRCQPTARNLRRVRVLEDMDTRDRR